jgi:hypothetical protein
MISRSNPVTVRLLAVDGERRARALRADRARPVRLPLALVGRRVGRRQGARARAAHDRRGAPADRRAGRRAPMGRDVRWCALTSVLGGTAPLPELDGGAHSSQWTAPPAHGHPGTHSGPAHMQGIVRGNDVYIERLGPLQELWSVIFVRLVAVYISIACPAWRGVRIVHRCIQRALTYVCTPLDALQSTAYFCGCAGECAAPVFGLS